MRSLFTKLLIGAGVAAVAVSATVALATHSWGGYHWARTANPFTLKVGDNLSSIWKPFLATASTDWSVSSVLDTTVVPGLAKSNCRATAGRVEVCDRTYGNTGWLGVAQIWVSGLHITQATVKLNDTYFNTPTYNTSAWRQFVGCQEVGHTFGLDHQDVNFNNVNLGTCMDYTNAPAGGVVGGFDYGPSNLHPNQHDYDELGIIYSHLDSFTTIGNATPNKRKGAELANRQTGDSENESFDNRADWGKSIQKDDRGNDVRFERDLGKDKSGQSQKVFTFIIPVN